MRIIILSCFILQAVFAFSQTSVVCSDYNIDFADYNTSSLEEYPGQPYSGPVAYFSFDAKAEAVQFLIKPATTRFQMELFLYELEGLDLIPIDYDNNTGSLLGYAAIYQADLEIGKEYIIAACATNGVEGIANLSISGNCYETTNAINQFKNNRILRCNTPLETNPGIEGGRANAGQNFFLGGVPAPPDTPNGFSVGDLFDAADNAFGTNEFLGHDLGHVGICDLPIFSNERTLVATFWANETSSTVLVEHLNGTDQLGFRYAFYPWDVLFNPCEELITDSIPTSNNLSENLTFPTDPGRRYALVIECYDEVGGDAALEADLRLTLDPGIFCENPGSTLTPIPLVVDEERSFTLDFQQQNIETLQNLVPMVYDDCNSWYEGSMSYERPYVYMQGTVPPGEYVIQVQGGLSDQIFNQIGAPFFLDVPVSFSLGTDDGVNSCNGVHSVASSSFEDIIVIDEEMTLDVFAFVDYNDILEETESATYALESLDIPLQVVLYKLDTYLRDQMVPAEVEVQCGDRWQLTEKPEIPVIDLLSDTHDYDSPLHVYRYAGDGNSVSAQLVLRGTYPGDFGSKSLTIYSYTPENGFQLLETFTSDLATNLNYNFPTQEGVEYFFLIQFYFRNDYNGQVFEIFNTQCVDCLVTFGPTTPSYDPNVDNPIIQNTIDAIPACCFLAWTQDCDDQVGQEVLDSLSRSALPISCGISQQSHSLNASLNNFTLNSDTTLGFGTGVRTFSFSGTGEEMTIYLDGTPYFVDLDPLIFLFTENTPGQKEIIGYDYDEGDKSASISFASAMDQTYYLVVTSNQNLAGSYELTITDDNQCGLCTTLFDGSFPGEIDDPVYNTLVTTLPGCCDEWSAGCQSFYETSVFPGCGSFPIVACGDTLIGQTIGEPIYAGQACGDQVFDAGSVWYQFVGDGNTWVFESVLPVNGTPFDTQLHLFGGECPKPICLFSDSDGGINQMGYLELPTQAGQEYFLAITGVAVAEGDFEVHARTIDYCGMCFSAFAMEHGYENDDPIYQKVIADRPSCCSSFWDYSECQLYYDLLVCSLNAEPNDHPTESTAWFFSSEYPASNRYSGAILDSGDEDYYAFFVATEGTMHIGLNSNALNPDLNLYLYDQNGVLVASSELFASLEFIDYLVDDSMYGQYFVQIKAADGSDFTFNECYELNFDWTPTTLPVGDSCPYDSNDDGLINATDLLAFLGFFGSTCE